MHSTRKKSAPISSDRVRDGIFQLTEDLFGVEIEP